MTSSTPVPPPYPPEQGPHPQAAQPFGPPSQPGQPGQPAEGYPPAYGGPPVSPGAGPGAPTDAQAPTRTEPAAGFDDKGRVRRGRVSAAWVATIATAVVLILLIIFIAQNSRQATIHYLGGSGSLSLGLIILIAAVFGVLLAAIPGSIRIFQLRRALKRNTPKDQRTP
ncbi:lipopolysaccharide assembly LapA domain-containing protein [uncultured Jatrophihabitans sp.]|uniref:LapA family protein n=1 Tax=uncultured Jatrophihabitans sp. TaxID=1610747 RepID=UPI0035CABF85